MRPELSLKCKTRNCQDVLELRGGVLIRASLVALFPNDGTLAPVAHSALH